MELKEFKEKLIKKICEELTDKAFLTIQENKELMQDYLHLLENNSLKNLNSEIAKEIKRKFKLKNIGKNNEPKSILIQGYEQFEMME